MTNKQRLAYGYAMGVLKANYYDEKGILNVSILRAYEMLEEALKEEKQC